MSFHYFMKPAAGGATHSYTTRPDNQPSLSEADFLAAVAAKHGKTVEEVGQMIDDIFDVLDDAARGTRPVEAIRNRFRTQPVSGGGYDDPSAEVTPENAGYGYSLIRTKDAILAVQQGLAVVSSGLEGRRTPTIATVRVLPGGGPNQYHPNGGLEARGSNLRDGANGVLPTADLVDLTGANPVALVVLDATEGRILMHVPTGVTGTRRLRVTATFNGIQVVTYQTLLPAA